MKILIRNIDSVVIYAEDDLRLTNKGASGSGWFDPNFTDKNAILERAKLPDDWVGGAWAYSEGAWSVVDSAALAAIAARKASLAATAAAQAKIDGDATAARGDAKLQAMGDMSPVQARAWINDNVKTLADAKDVLATLAVAVSILSRKAL